MRCCAPRTLTRRRCSSSGRCVHTGRFASPDIISIVAQRCFACVMVGQQTCNCCAPSALKATMRPADADAAIHARMHLAIFLARCALLPLTNLYVQQCHDQQCLYESLNHCNCRQSGRTTTSKCTTMTCRSGDSLGNWRRRWLATAQATLT